MLEAVMLWGKEIKRSHKRWRALQTADIVFLSPGKSGRTWVRVMLTYVLHLAYGTPADRLVGRDRLHRINRRVPRFFFSHAGKNMPGSGHRHLTPERLGGKTLICFVRDPRDVVVSAHYQRAYRSKRPSAAARSVAPSRPFLTVALRGVIKRNNMLQELAEAHPHGHLFRYEAFHADPTGELARLLKAIGVEAPATHVDSAVAFAKLGNLRQREAEGFFRSDNLRPQSLAEPNSFKVRRGKVGGYVDELDAETIEEFDRLVDTLMSPGLGYRSDERRRGSVDGKSGPGANLRHPAALR